MTTRWIRPALALILAAPALTACGAPVTDDPAVVVRAVTHDDAVTRYEIELDHHARVAWAIERQDGERAVLVTSIDGRSLAAARTDDDDVIDLDLAAMQHADGEVVCDAGCVEPDSITAEIIDLVLTDALPEAVGWRLMPSGNQKKDDDITGSTIDKLGG